MVYFFFAMIYIEDIHRVLYYCIYIGVTIPYYRFLFSVLIFVVVAILRMTRMMVVVVRVVSVLMLLLIWCELNFCSRFVFFFTCENCVCSCLLFNCQLKVWGRVRASLFFLYSSLLPVVCVCFGEGIYEMFVL